MTNENQPRVLLLLGSGPNIGLATLRKFKAGGYKTVAVSRNPSLETQNVADQSLVADFSDPSCIEGVFNEVKEVFGPVCTVIYNCFTWTKPSPDVKIAPGGNGTDPLAVPFTGFQKDLNVNTVSLYAAVRAALTHFVELPDSIPKTFLYTGNRGNTCISPSIFSLGASKAASWYMILTLVAAYRERGFRFYFVDERTPDGKAMLFISGKAHAETFWQLAEEQKEQGPALHSFVRGAGYKAFEGEDKVYLPEVQMQDFGDLVYGKEDSQFVIPE